MDSALASQGPSSARATGLRAARAAFAVGLLYAAISVYWGAGGTWLLDTVGSGLAPAAGSRLATPLVTCVGFVGVPHGHQADKPGQTGIVTGWYSYKGTSSPVRPGEAGGIATLALWC